MTLVVEAMGRGVSAWWESSTRPLRSSMITQALAEVDTSRAEAAQGRSITSSAASSAGASRFIARRPVRGRA